MARADHKVGCLAAVILRVLLARLIFVKPVAAQPKAKSEIGRGRTVPGSGGGLERNFDPLGAGELAEGEAAERDKVDRRVVFTRGDADDEESRSVETSRREDVEGAALGSAKIGRFRGGADQRLEIAELSRHRRGRLHVGSDEHDERAALGRGQRPEGNLDDTAHDKRASLIRISWLASAGGASPAAPTYQGVYRPRQ